MKQEVAPPGGFPAIRYARRIPNTGPTGATLFAVGAAVSLYGFYKIGISNARRGYAPGHSAKPTWGQGILSSYQFPELVPIAWTS